MYTQRTLIHTINKYRNEGYNAEFTFKNDLLVLPDERQNYRADQVTIIEEERFEGMTNPGDASIFFALETRDGHKGYITTGYGPTANDDLINFLAEAKTSPQLN